MTTMFVLIILMGGSTDGGRAVDTRLDFPSQAMCEEAARAVNENALDVSRMGAMRPTPALRAFCVKVR